ncbi:MAG TPA: glucose-6-phosphate dehydrogenase [Polyangiaceae bacterium]|jgi:glucose-6-phosphate 1-dehydrogenase
MKELEPSAFVIFGGTGDLARRKLLPALTRLSQKGLLSPRSLVVGVAHEDTDDEAYRKSAINALLEAGVDPDAAQRLCGERLFYHRFTNDGPEDFNALAARLSALEQQYGLGSQNRAIYLALPPLAFPATIQRLGEAGLNRSAGYTRLVIEKPFGRDLESARELNQQVHRHFNERQIYRIDHYLGKDTVQNLLVFRFANSIFESVWNRDRVESVQITVAEALGVGTRANYYDRSGAIRDMVQNHLTQLLTLFAMEVPAAFRAEAIRSEKTKVLQSIAPIDCANVVRGQYTQGAIGAEQVPGYLDERGVPAGSQTETFVAMKLEIDTWRWQGVPFYLRTGKRMARRLSQIAVRFRAVPVSLFRSAGTVCDSPDVLLITLQPDEGFSLHFDVKVPGSPFRLRRIPLSFKYHELFSDMPEAYETLLLDVLSGDQTLFVHSEEVEESWRVYQPLLVNPPPIRTYPAGSWGPKESEAFTIGEQELW